jgi:hypothetical protein
MTTATSPATRPDLDRFQNLALAVGVAGVLACIAGYFFDAQQFLRAYLVAFLFWAGTALGSLGLLMLHHLVGGAWGMLTRRILESATRTLPLVAVLLLPVLFNLPQLYKWARPDVVAHDPLIQHKAAYLNPVSFTARAALYFAIWIALTFLLNKWAAEQDSHGPDYSRKKLRQLSGPGIIFFFLSVTFAAVDWIMSLDPHWYSTIFGILYIVGAGLGALAMAIIGLHLMATREPMHGLVKVDHFHDLGKLMFALTMFWAYVNVSQFLIIWSGNLPEETIYYSTRFTGAWLTIAGIILVLHFVLPFSLLLFRWTKKNMRVLALICALLFVMRLVDLFWVVAPNFLETHFTLNWMDIVAPVALGGVWLGYFARQMKRRPLQPVDLERLAAYGEQHL